MMSICTHDQYGLCDCVRTINGTDRLLMMCENCGTLPLRFMGVHRCVDPLSVCVYRPVAGIENEAFACAMAPEGEPTPVEKLRSAADLIRECRDPDLDMLLDHIERKVILVEAREFTRRARRRFGPFGGDR